jgi:hypothetical protein
MGLLMAEFAVGPLRPLDLTVIEQIAIVNGNELHLLHITDGHNGFDGVVDLHNLTRVLDLLVLGRTAWHIVSRRFLQHPRLLAHLRWED